MIVMYDDVNIHLIPPNPPAVAGYVNGRYANYTQVLQKFPHAYHLSIAVTSMADAQCLDVEPGDATNQVAPGWVKRQQARGVHRPCLYTSVSNAQALIDTLARVGIKRADVRIWTAHYDPHRGKHLCGPQCGFGLKSSADATQWTDVSHKESLDESICLNSFFAAAPVPPPPPPPPVPVPPKPPTGHYLHLRNKDGSELFVPYTKAGRIRRGTEFAAGKFWTVEEVWK